MPSDDLLLRSYSRRLLFYFVPVLVASLAGALYAHQGGNWPEVSPLSGLFAAVLSLGVPIVIAALAPCGTNQARVVVAIGVIGMLVMWLLFSSRTASTSAAVFIWGPAIGIPLAMMFALIHNRTERPAGESFESE